MEGKKGVKESRFDLIPYDALWQVALVFGKGAEKYADRNWERGYEWSKSFAALHRHLALFWQGEDIDDESGLPHMAHVTWHSLVLLSFMLREAGVDNRPGESLNGMVARLLNPEEIEQAKQEIERGKK